MPVIDAQALIEDRVQAIRRYHERTGIGRAQLDISGGVDSAVMAGLLARALGPNKITAVYSSIHSSSASQDRAREAASAFAIPLLELDISELFESACTQLLDAFQAAGYSRVELEDRMQADPVILGSFRSCIRAPFGRAANRIAGGGIRHGTGNECEDRLLRFYQKGGDGEVDSNPIAMLAKGEVLQLGHGLGVPHSILAAEPTPDLQAIGEDHNDEDELAQLYGVAWTYSKIDPASGTYSRVGSIEQCSRFLDRLQQHEGVASDLELSLLGDTSPDYSSYLGLAREFFQAPDDALLKFLTAARRAERSTRHKQNPNCPTLGTRRDLVETGILSDTLPAVATAPLLP